MNASVQSATIYILGGRARPRSGGEPRQLPDRAARPVCRERLFVQVILCGSAPELVGRTWSCSTVDVSDHRIEFLSDEGLAGDALVDLWVDLADRPGKIFLSGSVRSSVAGADGRHKITVDLDDGAATDIDQWCELLA
ncbi:MAG TPA: hypothetical protein VLA56_16480 [Pseudomonadales bacterium]|nr:hypothetical protein [Pseudomonadales bacterium]